MDIGEIRRVIEVEPLTVPVPEVIRSQIPVPEPVVAPAR